MSADKSKIVCPTCGKPNTWVTANTFKPFCSERCKLIDLGAWAAEDHKIPGNEIQLMSDEEPDEAP